MIFCLHLNCNTVYLLAFMIGKIDPRHKKKNTSHFKKEIFCHFKFYHSRKNNFRLDERLRKWPFSAKISLQLQGLIMWCFLVLGHCDKIHLRVEGVFCPVSISVPVHNCLKQFLKDHFRIW